MQIVIDIPEETYHEVCWRGLSLCPRDKVNLVKAIRNGTPLPKGHGRIGDLDALEKEGYKTVWCPFDKADSKFVMTFKEKGFDVNYGHIETGQDFFEYQEPQGDIVVSNPPFSKRDKIFQRLYEWDIPFALIINFNGLSKQEKGRHIQRT